MGSDYSCAGLNFDFLHILLSGGEKRVKYEEMEKYEHIK